MDAKIFRVNYKSDFILTLTSDAGWMTPFCIKFWTGAPSQAYYAQWDGETYAHCAYDPSEPTKLTVQFDDHHLPIGELKYQVAYHFTVDDFPNDTEDEVLNQANITTEIDGEEYQVMLDFTGETAPDIQFSLPAYANEAQRIANEQQRIAAEEARIQNEETRIAAEQTRQQNEETRIAQEEARVTEFARLKRESEAATGAANDAAALANQKAQLADDKAALAQAAATLAGEKAQLADDKAALADAAATLANAKAALAQQKATYAQTQGDYAKEQGYYAKEQGTIAEADHEQAAQDHTRAESDHTRAEQDHTTAANDHTHAASDHTTAASDHTRAESDHTTAANDHTTAASDHTRAESDHTTAASDHTRAERDHTRAESDHAAVEVYVDSLGAFDISAYHATGGVLAKYADLTAALDSNNGGGIPQSLQKGGMSVKFVQSSDNKYVQYRYMSDDATTIATFTNVANWQGVDVVPTVESENLINSSGVYEENIKLLTKGCAFGSVELNISGDSNPVKQHYNFVSGRKYLLRFSTAENDGTIGCYIYKVNSSLHIDCGVISDGKNKVDYLYEYNDADYSDIGIYRASGTVSQVQCVVYDLDSIFDDINKSIQETESSLEIQQATSGKVPDIINLNVSSSNVAVAKFFNFIPERRYLLRFSTSTNDGTIGCYLYNMAQTGSITCGLMNNGENKLDYFFTFTDTRYTKVGVYRASGSVSQVECKVYDLDSLLTTTEMSDSLTPKKILYKNDSVYTPSTLGDYGFINLIDPGSILSTGKKYRAIIRKPANGTLALSLQYASSSKLIAELYEEDTIDIVDFVPTEECGLIAFLNTVSAITKFSFELFELLDTQNIFKIAQNIIPIKKDYHTKEVEITIAGNNDIAIYNDIILRQKETYCLKIKRVGESSAPVEISIPTNTDQSTRITIGTLAAEDEEMETQFVMPFESGFVRLYSTTTGVEYEITISHIVYTDISSSISNINKRDYILVAASNSNSDIKLIADYVCTGTNDEITIQKAIDYANTSNIGKVRFANGLYNIDSFPKTATDYHREGGNTTRNVAILLPSSWKEIALEGQNCEYGFTRDYRNGVCFYVTETAYNSVGENPVSVLRGGAGATSILSGCAVRINNIGFVCYGSQKPITMFDCSSIDRIYAEKLTFIGYGNELLNNSQVGLNIPPVAIPQEGFIGLRMGTGSNDPQGYQFNNIGVWGFYEGIKVGGEHTIMMGCSSTICVYGWTFGNYEWVGKNQIVHPITMINCCDERNQHLMQLIDCGYHQEVTMINHNVECVPDKTPGGVVLSKMRASENFCGQISFTAMVEWNGTESGGNRKDFKLWEDGQGHTFKTINATHRLAGSSTERLSYSPTYMQHFFDETLNKEVICINPDTSTWVDVNGNNVDS